MRMKTWRSRHGKSMNGNEDPTKVESSVENSLMLGWAKFELQPSTDDDPVLSHGAPCVKYLDLAHVFVCVPIGVAPAWGPVSQAAEEMAKRQAEEEQRLDLARQASAHKFLQRQCLT